MASEAPPENLSETEALESETESDERNTEDSQQIDSSQLVAKKPQNQRCGNFSDSFQVKMGAVLVTAILQSVNCVSKTCLHDGPIQAIF